MSVTKPYTYRKLLSPRDKRILVLRPAQYLPAPLVAKLEHWEELPEPLARLDELFHLYEEKAEAWREEREKIDWERDGTEKHSNCLDTDIEPPELLESILSADTEYAQARQAYKDVVAGFAKCQEGYNEEDRNKHARNMEQHKKNVARYTAISYAWGCDTRTTPLILEAEEHRATLQIRTNVDELLRYLRHRQRSIHLWIDAVCINQDDITEKETQVQRMGDIYAQAEYVTIWIGLNPNVPPWTGEVFDLLRQVKHWGSQQQVREDLRRVPFRKIEQILELDWFYRRWIIQEVALAETAIMVSGHHRIKFEHFVSGLRAIVSSFDVKEEIKDVSEKLHLMESLQPTFHNRTPSPTPITTLLSIFHSSKCLDDRDRLFALKNLSPTTNDMMVSYSAPVEEIFYRFSLNEALLDPEALGASASFRSGTQGAPSWVADWRQRPRFTPIMATELFRRKSPKVGEPDTPQFTNGTLTIKGLIAGRITKTKPRTQNDDDVNSSLTRWYKFYRRYAHGKSPPNDTDASWQLISPTFFATLSVGDLGFAADGFLVNLDFIHLSLLMHGRLHTLRKTIQARYFTPRLRTLRPPPRLFPRSTDLLNPSWRRLYHGQVIANKIGKGTYFENDLTIKSRSQEIWTFISTLGATMRGRSCFVTDAGDFGIAPADAVPGDVVVLVPHCRIPLILRASTRPRVGTSDCKSVLEQNTVSSGTKGKSLKKEYWRVVGDCYIYRLMHKGEGLPGDEMREFRLV